MYTGKYEFTKCGKLVDFLTRNTCFECF